MPDPSVVTAHPFHRLARNLEPIATHVPAQLRLLEDIKAVVFDIYGTLVISGSGDVGSADPGHHQRALAEAVSYCGLPELVDPQAGTRVQRDIIELSHQRSQRLGITHPEVDILAVWRAWLAQHADGDSAVKAIARELALEYEARANPSCSMPGATETIRRIADRDVALGIVSNAQFFTLDLLEITLGADPISLGFDPNLSFFSYRFGAAKPGSELFDALVSSLSRRSILPSEALYVGNDMLNDVYGAGQAGLRTALFAGDARSLRMREDDSRVADYDADIVITSLDQLIDVL